jgi:hypothetical protein
VRSPANEEIVLAMWAGYDRDGLTGSSPDLRRLLAEPGLPGRAVTNEAFMAMHGGEPPR